MTGEATIDRRGARSGRRRQRGQRARRNRFLIAGAAAAACAFLGLTLIMMLLAGHMKTAGTGTGAKFEPSAAAIADIPEKMLALYLQAGNSSGLDWAVIAAIGWIETNHCRSTLPGVHSGANGSGAKGCMQFLQPTWDAYGVDGNHDGRKSPYDASDAIPAAATLLKANGAPGDYRRAIFAYNHANWYVDDVLAKASEYRGALAAASGGLGQSPGQMIVSTRAAADVLRLADGPRPRITLNAIHRNDLRTGQIDPRVSSLLVAIAGSHRITITALKGDHNYLTSSGNVSNHSGGRAVDIAIVDGEKCNSDAHGRTGQCWQLARELAEITGPLHPTELIYGIDPDGSSGPAFAQADHRNHVHAGWDAR